MLIRNNKKDFNPTDKPFIEVADSWNLCSQLSRQSEWQFRIYAQMISTQDIKNWFFFTLTFDEKHLPTYTFDGVTCPCFSRDCIHRFCRGIQMDLLKHHKVIDIDYLIASEFGSDQYSARPHHHGVLGVDKSVSPDIVHTLIKKHWSVLTGEYFRNGLPKREQIGYVYPRLWYGGYDKKGHFHNPVMLDPTRYDSAAIYTSKYCCKQIGFFKNPKVKCLMRHLNEKGKEEDIYEWNRVKPFIYVSKHFGEIICEWVEGYGVPSPVKVDKDPFVNMYEGVWTPLRKKSKTRIPYYCRRKLLYDRVPYSEVVDIDKRTDELCTDYDDIFPEEFYGVAFAYRPDKRKYYKRYTYRYDTYLSDFGCRYLEYEYDRRIREKEQFILNNQNCLGDHFDAWCKDHCINSQIFMREFRKVDPHALAVYSVVYKDHVSPAHYIAWSLYPEKFANHLKIEQVAQQVAIKCGKGYHYDLWEDAEIYTSDYYGYVSLEVDITPETQVGLNLENSLQIYFSGAEELQIMIDKSKDYYMSKVEYISRCAVENAKPDQYNILFNSFDCFSGFDRFLAVVEHYHKDELNAKVAFIQSKFDDKKRQKDKFNSFN